MKVLESWLFLPLALLLPAAFVLPGISSTGGGVTSGSVPVKMTVTASVDKGRIAPAIEKKDVFVKNGKESLPVLDWTPARDGRAGLELFVLIDDASTSSLGSQLNDLRAFVKAQPPTTAVGIGYANNGEVQVRQNFTTDHDAAARALRLPTSSVGAYGSPYLSVTRLMKRWPDTANRHEVLLITDGIDRAGRGRNALMNPDVDAAAASFAQKTGTIIHTLYFPGIGHRYRNWFEAVGGQNALAKLSDFTGGEYYFLGRQEPVAFAPYLDDLRKILDNQYLPTFAAKPDKKSGFQYVRVGTELAGVDFNSADAVWVRVCR